MSPEYSEPVPTPQNHEKEGPFEVAVGDVLFVGRTVKGEDGKALRNPDNTFVTVPEDGWEVRSLNAIDPRNGREAVMLQNTANEDEMKFYSVEQLEALQERAEAEAPERASAEVLERASQVAAGMLQEIDEHSHEIAEEESRITEEFAEQAGEVVMDAADIDDPAEANVNEAQASLKFDVAEAKRQAAEREERRLIPSADLQDAHGLSTHFIDMARIAYEHPGPEGARQIDNMDSAIVSTVDSLLMKLSKGRISQEAAAFEVGVMLSTVRNYHAAEVAIRKIDTAEGLFPEDQKRAMLELAESIRENGLHQGQSGEHFAQEAYNIDQAAYNRFEAAGNKPDLAYLAYMGAGVGLYSRVGGQYIGTAYGRLSGALERIRSFEK